MIIDLISTFGFAVAMSMLFNIKRQNLFFAGLIATLSRLIYLFSSSFGYSEYFNVFFATAAVGILGEMFAKNRRAPATVFVIAGIVAYVPGLGLYNMMIAIVDGDFQRAAFEGSQTLFIAASIACGIIFSLSIRKIIKRGLVKHH